VCLEEANKILKTFPDLTVDTEPIVRFKEFGESSINLTVIIKAKDYQYSFLLKHTFIKNIFKRFEQENIVIPFPHLTVEMKNKND